MGDDVTSHVNLSATASVHRGPRRDYYNDSMSCTPTQRLGTCRTYGVVLPSDYSLFSCHDCKRGVGRDEVEYVGNSQPANKCNARLYTQWVSGIALQYPELLSDTELLELGVFEKSQLIIERLLEKKSNYEDEQLKAAAKELKQEGDITQSRLQIKTLQCKHVKRMKEIDELTEGMKKAQHLIDRANDLFCKQRQYCEAKQNALHEENGDLVERNSKLDEENIRVYDENARLLHEITTLKDALQEEKTTTAEELKKQDEMWRCLLNAAKQRYNSTHLCEVGKQQLRNVGERTDFVQSHDCDQTTTADHDSGHPTSDIKNNPTTLKATECLSTVEEYHEQVELPSPVVCSPSSGSATLSNNNSLKLSKGSALANLEEKEHVEDLVRSSVGSDHENDLNDDQCQDTTKVHNTQAMQESRVMKAKFQENQLSDDLKDSHSMLGKRDVKVPVDLHVRKPHQPMISTQSFDIGDLALFCYSEDIEMYVAFSTSCEKHFLHPESQKKLQPSTANTSKGSDPILMVITNREFCKITKDENEFNLPVDMKFWRLSASRFIPNVAC